MKTSDGGYEGLLECKTTALDNSMLTASVSLATMGMNEKKVDCQALWVYLGHGRLYFYSFDIDPRKRKELNLNNTNALRNFLQLNRQVFLTKTLLDIIPLCDSVYEEANAKKDRPTTAHAFCIVHQTRKLRVLLCAETKEEVDQWIYAYFDATDLSRSNIFGTTITDACIKSNAFVPLIVQETINRIDTQLEVEGLFRIPGDGELISEFSKLYDSGISPSLLNKDVSLSCSLLKFYIRDLRDPLIPMSAYDYYMEITQENDPAKQLAGCKELIKKLPICNRLVLYTLFEFLARVDAKSEKNKMNFQNLAIVFAPTVVQKKGIGVKSDSDALLGNVSSINALFLKLIEKRDEIFFANDREMCQQTMIEIEDDPSLYLTHMTPSEKVAMNTLLEPLQRGVETLWSQSIHYMVIVENPKSRVREDRILFLNLNRLCLFQRGGKVLEYSINYFEIDSIHSDSKSKLTINYTLYTTPGKQSTIEIFPLSYGSFDMDNVIAWINRQWDYNFIHYPTQRKIHYNIEPQARRLDLLSSSGDLLDSSDYATSGLVRSYVAICDLRSIPVNEEIIWDLEEFFFRNGVRSIDFGDIIKADRFPNPEFESLMAALVNKRWFLTMSFKDMPLGNDSCPAIAEIFRNSATITDLNLSNTGISKLGVQQIFQAFENNENCKIIVLDISENPLDMKCTSILINCLRTTLSHLVSLNLSKTDLQKKTMQSLLEAFSTTTSILGTLTNLDLSFTKLDTDTSRILGVMLANAKVLARINLCNSGPDFKRLMDGMTDGKTIKTCASLLNIDLSQNLMKVEKKASANTDVVQFCSLHVPNLTEINLRDCGLNGETVIQILQKSGQLVSLDVSDNEFTDTDFLDVFEIIAKSKLRVVKANRTVSKVKPMLRKALMQAVGVAAGKCGLEKLHMEGGKSCPLKSDVSVLVLSLVHNTSLTELNLQHNQGGDELANAIARLLRYNPALTSLALDGNDFTLHSLKTLLHYLQRNKSIVYFPFLFMDVNSIYPDSVAEQETLQRLLDDIHLLVLRNIEESKRSGGEGLEETLRREERGSPLLAQRMQVKATQHNTRLNMVRAHELFGTGALEEYTDEEEYSESHSETSLLDDNDDVVLPVKTSATPRDGGSNPGGDSALTPTVSPTLNRPSRRGHHHKDKSDHYKTLDKDGSVPHSPTLSGTASSSSVDRGHSKKTLSPSLFTSDGERKTKKGAK